MRIFGDRRGAANLSPLLMIVAFASMIGFLVWLGQTSEGTETQAFNPPEEEVDPLERGAIRVTEGELQQPEGFVGETVRVEGQVASRVGSQAFFLDFSAAPFLVKRDSSMAAAGGTQPGGDVVVVGTVYPMTDSVVTNWVESGLVSEGDRPIVEFATHFIEAAIVRQNEDAGEDADTASAPDMAAEGGRDGA